jgi:cytochrome c-type biogenesis protein CcmH
MRSWVFAISLLLALASTSAFAIDPLPFKDRAQEVRFQKLAAELRCLVCQNQNLADSDATLAQDLREEVFQMMQQGKSDDEIRDFLVQRYGEFVLYDPPIKPSTWLLWFGPALIVVFGALAVFRIARRRARSLPADAVGEEDLPA